MAGPSSSEVIQTVDILSSLRKAQSNMLKGGMTLCTCNTRIFLTRQQAVVN